MNLDCNGSVNSKPAHPPPPRAFVLFFQIMLQMPHGGVSSYVQIPTVGLLEERKRPTHTALSRVTDDQM